MERNRPKCYFDEYDDICAALFVKACNGCKFYQSTADYIDGQMKAEKILEEKGLKPIEYRDKCGVLHKYVMKEGV